MVLAINLQDNLMRTKLFAAFLSVIFLALISNLIFQWLIMRDFDDYVRGVREDHLYWVLASVEGSYQKDRWDMNLLNEAIHWAMMLGFEVMIKDARGQEVSDSHRVMEDLPESMRHRMASIIHLHSSGDRYEAFPLFIRGEEIGTMYVRPISIEGSVRIKEMVFKKRGRHFLMISFLIAGLSAIVMAIFLSLNLTRPLRRLKAAAEEIAEGNFKVRAEESLGKRRLAGIFEKDEVERLSESFNYMARTLEKEDLLRQRLTSNIAHELRTPLTIMKANIEAILDGVVTDVTSGLKNIRSEIERLQRLIEGIEDLARAEASFIKKGEVTSINLRELLLNIISSMSPLFKEKGLTIKMVEERDLYVVTDTEKIESIIRNILSNSLKYTEEGGVKIDYGYKEGRKGERKDRNFFIEITDTGIGISEEDRERVFRRFQRLNEDIHKDKNMRYCSLNTSIHSPLQEGLGLGLAIVKELVEVMGGKIILKSQIGEGTTFRIELPNLIS
jgi:two-component system sensor histidine kinase BaeS